MLKKMALLFGFFPLFTMVGVAQEDGWTTLTVGQSVYGIRYDDAGAVIVNNDVIMGCVPIPESYGIALNASPPSPIKKLVLVICSRADDGDEAYIIDTVRNRVASRDVVPKHWQIRHWVSWSPDERFALVMAAGEITNGDMVFVDLRTGKAEEIEFKTLTNNPQIKRGIVDEIQDFDPNGLAWINPKSFRLRLDVQCNPYQDAQCDREKILRSLAAQVNLNPFSISYGISRAGSLRTKPRVSVRGSRAGKGILKVNSGGLTNIRQFDYKNSSYPISQRCVSLLSRRGNIRLKDGNSATIRRAPYSCLFAVQGDVSYSNMTGDGAEEALVYAGCSCANTVTLSNFEESDVDLFVYTLRNGEAALLTSFDYDNFSQQGYNRIYQSHFKDGTKIVTLGGAPKIEGGLLVLNMLAYGGNFRFDPPDYKVEMKYRWNGSKFVLAEKPQRQPVMGL